MHRFQASKSRLRRYLAQSPAISKYALYVLATVKVKQSHTDLYGHILVRVPWSPLTRLLQGRQSPDTRRSTRPSGPLLWANCTIKVRAWFAFPGILFLVGVGLQQGCPLPLSLFQTFMGRMSGYSRRTEGVTTGGFRISSPLWWCGTAGFSEWWSPVWSGD